MRYRRILKRRAQDVLVQVDRPGTSNSFIEAISRRFEHLCGSVLGFGDPTCSVPRALLETGGLML